ncbi:hypothetical protein J2X90_002109 [Variovorax paradoxus]|uniref:hypothetical protein n=1 Tax=Variovorax paradoxus TaxID=34073 RepID=UPI00278531D5|nr:hypothetical protein [Variovorax paradoxus]MDQ0024314.1 hypothetical protein [Variovorax paradoxus]
MAFIGADFRQRVVIRKIENSDQLIWISDYIGFSLIGGAGHRVRTPRNRHDGVYQIGPESLRAFLSTRPLTTPTERHP